MYLEIKNLSKNIKSNTILSNINISMEKGKIYGLWGKNGSGKTMLMRCVCGLVFPTEGEVCINGKVMGKDISFPESVGVLIENPGFIEHYSAGENLKAVASVKGIAKEEDNIKLLELLGLDYYDKKKVKKYSLGMRQKLGIAAALMENPELIILDEPINALDEESVKKVKELLVQHKKRGALIIVSCHDRYEMEQLADEIYCIENGSITKHFTLDEQGEGWENESK